jgi:Cu/Zn superoxide dismutase
MKHTLTIALAVLGLIALPVLSHAGTLCTADADGDQEVPPTGSLATAHSDMYLNHAETSIHIKVTVQNFGNTITACHIHSGAPGQNGGVVFSIGAFTGSIEADWNNPGAANITALKAGNLYLNIHSNIFPGGEIRGQIGLPGSLSFEANLDGNQEVPPTGSLATGYGDVTVDGNGANLHIELSVSNFTNTITGAHIHAAPPGQNGGVIFNIGAFTGSTRADFPLTAAQYATLRAGGYYVNIHSNIFPSGEIRGQLGNNSPADVPDGIANPAFSVTGYPNPVLQGAVVHYSIPASLPGDVAVFDAGGRLVRRLADGMLQAGETNLTWDGRDAAGRPVPSGTYYYRLQAGTEKVTQKAIVLR